MYTSPLRDASGNQTGWMTSVTILLNLLCINELANAREIYHCIAIARYSRVSCFPGTKGDLFTNDTYQRWFSSSSINGHALLVEKWKENKKSRNTIYISEMKKWFDTRLQQIKWVDGRVVELLVASDVTSSQLSDIKHREEYAKYNKPRDWSQWVKWHPHSHELNQPLTAISNYTLGGGEIKHHCKRKTACCG